MSPPVQKTQVVVNETPKTTIEKVVKEVPKIVDNVVNEKTK